MEYRMHPRIDLRQSQPSSFISSARGSLPRVSLGESWVESWKSRGIVGSSSRRSSDRNVSSSPTESARSKGEDLVLQTASPSTVVMGFNVSTTSCISETQCKSKAAGLLSRALVTKSAEEVGGTVFFAYLLIVSVSVLRLISFQAGPFHRES